MLFWHLGMTCAIVFFALGARRIDYRVVLLGAILPDLIDKPVGRILFAEEFQSGRLFGHTLVVATGSLLAIQLVLRGKTARRWFVLPIAMLIHHVLDAMWNEPIAWFWPLFGTEFPPDPVDGNWWEALLRPFTDPWVLVQEAAGLAVLLFLARAYRLHEPALRSRFVRRGELIERPERMSRSDRLGGPDASDATGVASEQDRGHTAARRSGARAGTDGQEPVRPSGRTAPEEPPGGTAPPAEPE